jgi:hypothetical protein
LSGYRKTRKLCADIPEDLWKDFHYYAALRQDFNNAYVRTTVINAVVVYCTLMDSFLKNKDIIQKVANEKYGYEPDEVKRHSLLLVDCCNEYFRLRGHDYK